MTARNCRRLMLLATATMLCLLTGDPLRGEVPRNEQAPPDTLQGVLDRIRLHAADDAWQEVGWRDEQIEKWLETLVATLSKEGNLPNLKLPVNMAKLKPASIDEPLGQSNRLVVGQIRPLIGLRDSFVLADNSVELISAENSIVIARGAVSLSGTRNCVIVAGACISGQFDGNPGGGGGSVLVTRGWIDVSTAYGSVLAARSGITVNRSQEAVFVNAEVPPVDRVPRHNGSRSVKVNHLPVEGLPVQLLSSQIKLLGMMLGLPNPEDPLARRNGLIIGTVFQYGGRRYAARIGETVTDEAGNPVAGLERTKLAYATDRVAIFRQRETDIAVRFEK